MNPVPDHVNVTGRKEAPDWPRVSPDVIGCDADKWPVTTELRSPGHHSSSENIPRSHNEIVTDPALSRLLWWGIFWNFKMTQSVMWCGHREHNHLSPIGPSDIIHQPGCVVTGHNECLQWSDNSTAHSDKYYKLLIATQSCNNLNTIQNKYQTLKHVWCLWQWLYCCPLPLCHITRPLCSIHLSWPCPHLSPGLCLSPITRISHRSPGSAQPCHPSSPVASRE